MIPAKLLVPHPKLIKNSKIRKAIFRPASGYPLTPHHIDMKTAFPSRKEKQGNKQKNKNLEAHQQIGLQKKIKNKGQNKQKK